MNNDSIKLLQRQVDAFASARDWDQFHDPKNLSMALASEAGELAAVLRWTPNSEADTAAANTKTRDALLNEIGDLGILLLRMCSRLDLHLGEVIAEKLRLNAQNYPESESRGRPERHP